MHSERDLVVFDLEATCWEKGTRPERMETIEIGAVRIEAPTWTISGEFSRFVRPTSEPILSEFCVSLTGIAQSDVDAAEPFPVVFEDFVAWVESSDFVLCSWGAYDPRQLQVDCRRHAIKYPESFGEHINLKKEFAAIHGIKPCGMKRALSLIGIPLEGKHHRGIDDARNISQIFVWLKQNGGF